jgi:hypothetical protein
VQKERAKRRTIERNKQTNTHTKRNKEINKEKTTPHHTAHYFNGVSYCFKVYLNLVIENSHTNPHTPCRPYS